MLSMAVDKKAAGAGKVIKPTQKTRMAKQMLSRTLHSVLLGCGRMAQNCLSQLTI